MKKFIVNVEDFKSFINSLGYKSDFQVDWIGARKTELSTRILNSNYAFDMYLEHKEIHQLCVDVSDIDLYLRVYYIDGNDEIKEYSSEWRKHLCSIYGKKYYDYIKNYCEKHKSRINEDYDRDFKNLISEIDYNEQCRKQRLKHYDDILNDLNNNDLTM